MNKIYKLIWSKVKNMWVVASELAKSHTKSPNSGIVGVASLASLESKINMDLSKGFVAGVFPMVNRPVAKLSDFKITVAAIVKNEADNVPTWVQAARSCADEIIVVDTGSTDGTVERFADYGIKCFHYDWNDDFASAKNYMISLCHGDWIVLLDGDEWFREGCDVRKAIAKHHGNPITKAIIADWICLDKDRNNTVMFSGGAVRAFRNQPDVRYFRKVHENLTINYENFAFEPDFKMYHTGYSGSVNRSKHERNLRIMRTMFDFDNGKVEYPTDWRYIEDTYAGLGDYPKALWAADNMISFGVQEYSASAWITKFNVLFAMRTPLVEMRKQFEYCFQTVPSISGFRFLASIYYFRNGLVSEGLDNYIEGLRMLMGPQDKVAMEHTYWRMYMPEASALASTVYLQNKQFEASLYACKVCEQYCGQTDWTNGALADIRRLMDTEGISVNIADRILPVLSFSKKAVLATALISSLTVGLVKPVYAACCNLNEVASNSTTGNNSTVTGGYSNTVSGCNSSISGGCCNTVTNEGGSISGGYCNFVGLLYSYNFGGKQNFITPDTPGIVGGSIYQYNGSNYFLNTYRGSFASISGGQCNTAIGCYSSVSGGICNTAAGEGSSISGGKCNYALGLDAWVGGGTCGQAYACYSSVIGGGITGVWNCTWTAHHSVAIGQCATTTRDYEVAIGSACAPVKIGGNLTVTGTNTVTDGTTTKTWSDLLNASGGGSASISNFVINSTGNSISVTGTDAVAIGYNAKATGSNTVAIGSQSITNGDNVVSFGHDAYTTAPDSTLYTSALYRKLINVADGTDAHDVATVGQVGSLVQTNMNSILNSDSISLACSTGAEYYSIAIGACSNAGGKTSDELGNNIVIGHCATATLGEYRFTPYEAIAIGHNSLAQSNSVALGAAAYSYDGGIAIGRCSYVAYGCSIAIGMCSTAMTTDVVSFGHKAGDTYRNLDDGSTRTHNYSLTRRLINISDGIDDSDAVTVGQLNTALASAGAGGGSLPNTLALGTCGTTAACANGTNALAIGEGAVASGDKAISIGTGNQVRGDNSGAIGDPNIVDANNSYTVGNNSTISANVDGAFVLGNNVTVNNGTLPANWNSLTDEQKSDITGEGVVALGNNVSVSLCNKVNSSRSSDSSGSPKIQHVVAIGDSSVVGEENAMALGYQAQANALNALAFGSNAQALSEGGTAIGHNAKVNENSSFATVVGYDAEATGEAANAFGYDSTAGAKFATAFGRKATASAEAATAIGNDAKALSQQAVAIGGSALANGGANTNAVAIGRGATVGSDTQGYGETVAIGGGANVQNYYSTAVGSGASVTGQNSVALGQGAVASEANVVSVGKGTAGENIPATRRIVNVTDGTSATDAATVGQVRTVSEGNGIVLTETANTNGSKNEAIAVKAGTNVTVDTNGVNVIGNGAVASADTGLISGGTAYSELRPTANGNYIATANTTAQNLGALDSALKTADNTAIKNITSSGTTVTFTKGDGTTGTFTTQDNNTEYTAGNGLELIGTEFTAKAGTNVTVDNNGINVTGNGTVADGNTGLVSGGMLFTEGRVSADGSYVRASNTVAGNLTALDTAVKANADDITQINTDLAGKANTSLNNITNDGKSVIKTNAKEAINVKGSGKVTVDKTDVSGVDTYIVGVTVDGAVAEGNTGIVDGGTVYTALQAQKTTTDTALTGKANVALDNVTEAGHSMIKSDAKSAINAVAGTHTTIAKTDVDGVDTYAVNVTTDGTVTDGNTGIVTGGTVYTALNNEKTAREAADTVLQGNIDTEVTARENADTALSERIATNVSDIGNLKDLSNITDAGKTVVRDLAKGSVNVVGNGLASVAKTNAEGVDTYTVSVVADGEVADGNAKLVNGGVVHTAIQNAVSDLNTDVQTALAGKANVALDNVTDAGHVVIKSDAKSALNVVGGTYATVDKTDVNGVDTYTVNVATDGVVANGNAKLVTGGTVYTALQSQNTELQTALDGKSNVGLDNITDDGKSVVRTLAQESVKVVNGTNTTVTEGTDGTYKTYAVNTKTDGSVADGDTGIVTGGAVYDAIQDAVSDLGTSISTNLDSKANTSLDNVTVAGHSVIKTDAKSALNVTGSGYATVTKTDVDGVDTYAVNVAANGLVVDGNTGLVTGDTVYDEVRPASDGNYIAAANTTGANLSALDTQVKANTDAISNNKTHFFGVNSTNEYDMNYDGGGAVGTNAVAIGTNAWANTDNSIAIGPTSATMFGEKAIAVGYLASALAENALAVGASAQAPNSFATAVGNKAIASGWSSTAIGKNAYASGKNSIAVGSDSTALGEDEFSVGRPAVEANAEIGQTAQPEVKRRITHVDTGVNDTDAVNVKQLDDALYDKADWNAANIGRNLVLADDEYPDGMTDEQKAEHLANVRQHNLQSWGQALGAGTVTGGDSRLVTGDTVHVEVRPAENGTYVKTNNTTGQNLLALDQQLSTVLDGNASQNTAISDLQNEMETKANVGLNNITDAGKTVVRDLAKESVKVVNGTNTTVTEGTDGNAKTYAVNAVTDGAVVDGNTGIVTGGTVYSAIQDMIDGKANVALDNVTEAGHTVIKTDAKSAVNVTGNSDVTVTKTDVDGVDTYNVAVVKTGTVTDGNEGVVTGGTVYDALTAETRPAADGNYIGADHTAGANLTVLDTQVKTNADAIAVNTTDITNLKDLSNITDAGQTVVKNLAKGSVNVVGANKALVTKTNVDGVDTYTVDVKADGVILADNKGLVDGGTVFDAVVAATGNIIDYTNDGLAGKANMELDNVTAVGHTVIKTDAKSAINVAGGTNAEVVKTDVDGVDTYTVNVAGNGQVAENNTGLMNGGTVYSELRPTDGNYIRKDVTTAANLSALDTKIGTVANGDFVQSANTVGQNLNALDEALYDKANWDASNVGRNTVVTDDDYPAGLTDEQKAEYAANLRDYNLRSWGQALGAGTVTGGDARLITGDTLHVEVRPANSGTYVKVDKTTGENLLALDEQLSSVVNGASAQNTTINNLENEMANKANIALDNINADGQNVVRNIAKSAVVVADGPNTTVASSTDTDGNITYRVTANATGSVTDGNTGLVDGGAVYTAIENAKAAMGGDIGGLDADGNYIRKANTVAENLVALDTQVKTNADGLAAEQMAREAADTALGDRIGTLTADGNYIAKDSSVSENLSSLDTAVKSVRDKADSNTADITNLKDLSNITAAGETVIKDLAKGSVKVINGTRTTVTEGTDGDTKTFAVNVDADGTVTDGNTGLVTGDTVYDALQNVQGSVTAAMADKANVSLDNLDADGINRVRDISKAAVSVANGTNTTASSVTDADGNVIYKVNVAANGSVASGNAGIMSGGMMYDELRPADGNYVARSSTTAANLTALDAAVKEAMTKAETAQAVTGGNVVVYDTDDRSSVTLGGADGTAIHNVADGAVTADSKDAVTGGQLYTVKSAVDANTTAIAGLNTRVQDNTTAIDTLRTTVTNGLDGKTDTDLGNLTDVGKDAVRDLAKESVRVADGVNTTVRTTVDGDASVYHVDVAANGRVESGNTGIVTGDAVYEAIRDIEVNASDTHYVSINPSEKDDETFANHGASGADAVAIGAKSYASGDESVAIGHNNDVSGNETYVIGSDVNATGNNSVVLGKGSDGSLDNVVSVGSAGNERRIVHVADGELSADSKDAVNGKQLYEVREKLQSAEGIDVDKWSDALGTGSVAPGDERLVKGSTVYSAIQSTGISLSPDGSTMNVGAANNATVVDFTNSEGNGRVLQGIVTDPGNPNSAANVGYVNAIGQNIVNGVNSGLNRLDTKINKVGAGAAALASLEPMPFDDDQKWSISAAIGTYHGTQAGAVGVFYKPQDNVMLNIRGAIGNGENMGGAGLSIGLNKGAAKGLSKSSMAKAMNAQANEIVAQKQLIENQQAQLDAQKAEIEELKQMVRSVVASKQVDK